MYAVISRDKIQLPPGTVIRMPGTWQQNSSRYFPEINLQALCDRCLQIAAEQGTGVAIRDLRQFLT